MYSLTPQSPSKMTHTRGFTIVEVLVALVVLSIGLLGIAKLVMVSSHANDSAYLRSQATAMAYQMIDNMRANLAGASAGNYSTALNGTPLLSTTCLGTGTQCSNLQLAQWDVYSWQTNLSAALPSGTGSIVTSATSPVTATVVVQWDDSAAQAAFGAASAAQTANTQIIIETVLL